MRQPMSVSNTPSIAAIADLFVKLHSKHRLPSPALGITNAVQGTSSNFSIKVGNKVFTTSAPFPFERLPPELRMEIIEMALEMSKE
jgi:hypothetical protein